MLERSKHMRYAFLGCCVIAAACAGEGSGVTYVAFKHRQWFCTDRGEGRFSAYLSRAPYKVRKR